MTVRLRLRCARGTGGAQTPSTCIVTMPPPAPAPCVTLEAELTHACVSMGMLHVHSSWLPILPSTHELSCAKWSRRSPVLTPCSPFALAPPSLSCTHGT